MEFEDCSNENDVIGGQRVRQMEFDDCSRLEQSQRIEGNQTSRYSKPGIKDVKITVWQS